jgi:RNA polymerase sigma-70 factor (ECF subfamily)
MTDQFELQVADLFRTRHERLFRLMHRLTGEPDMAADIAQDAFVRMYERGSMPDTPDAWLVSVALNLFRNHRRTRARRRGLLTPARAEGALADPRPSPEQVYEAGETRARVRRAIDHLTERERALLLMHAEGYSYREIAAALGINEASLGTLLARAKRAFRERYNAE